MCKYLFEILQIVQKTAVQFIPKLDYKAKQ